MIALPKESPNNGPAEDSHWIHTDQLADEGQRRVLQNAHYVLPHKVQILLTHVRHLKTKDGNG